MTALLYARPAGPDEDGEVVRVDAVPMEISTEGGDVMWCPVKWGTRTKARQWFASETGCDYIEVRCTVEWLHCVDRYEEARKVSEWADEMWFSCEPISEGAHKFWRCEFTPRPRPKAVA